MKKISFCLILFSLFVISCTNQNATKKLNSFLQTYSVDINKYRVICFIPADGCSSCIDPSLDYSKKAKKEFIVVLSSIYIKSIDHITKSKQIEKNKIISDSENLAAYSQLVPITAPCFYFLKNGHVTRIIDLSNTKDKTSILKEVDQFLSKYD